MKSIIYIAIAFIFSNYETKNESILNLNKNNKNLDVCLFVQYSESLNIPNDLLEELPQQVKVQVATMLNQPKLYNYKFNGNSSSYIIDKTNEMEKKFESNGNHSSSFSIAEFSTHKDLVNNILSIKTGIHGKEYIIKKSIEEFKWTITDEKKKIGEYICKKATTKDENGPIIAYFTDKIPVSEGPSIYGGLPGFILYLEAPDRTYTAKKIQLLDKIQVENLEGGKRISEKEYLDLIEKNKNKKIVKERIEERTKIE
jgi:GLPGLI family protein